MIASKRNLIVGAFFLGILLLIIISLLRYNENLSERLYASTEKTLYEVAVQQKFNFDSEAAAEKVTLQSIATAISYLPDDPAEIRSMLTDVVKHTRFEYLTFTDANGIGFTQDGIAVDISNRPYFSTVLAGETVLWKPILSVVRGITVIPLATPVFKNGQVTGVLIGSYTVDRLAETLLPSFDGKGYALIFENDGNVIISTSNEHTLSQTGRNTLIFCGRLAAILCRGITTPSRCPPRNSRHIHPPTPPEANHNTNEKTPCKRHLKPLARGLLYQ